MIQLAEPGSNRKNFQTHTQATIHVLKVTTGGSDLESLSSGEGDPNSGD